MDKRTLREWFDKIMAHARANYRTNGWDNFVEGIGFDDFVAMATRPAYGSPGEHRFNSPGPYRFNTYEDAFSFYTEWCDFHAVP